MHTWLNSGMTREELVEEYVEHRKSISQICRERQICGGAGGAGEMSIVLQQMGHEIRSGTQESAAKRGITRGNMEVKLGISWDELVAWYNTRKTLVSLCDERGLNHQRVKVLKRLLSAGGILTDDPLRGYGFTEDELVKMYTDGGMSMGAIYRKFKLGRAAERVVSSILRKRGVHRYRHCSFSTTATKYTASDGYVRVLVTTGNTHLTHIPLGGHEMEHRLVVAKSLRRPLERNEWVHHINRNTADNRIVNLLLIDKSTHRRIHTSMDGVIQELFREGMVVLDDNHEYELKESAEYNRGFTDGIGAMLELE